MSAVLRDTPAAEAEEIVSSSFVLDTLQTALWTVLHGADFEHAVTIAVNMGNDATAAGATTGALAGAVYGESGIPARWLDALTVRDRVTAVADRLAGARLSGLSPPDDRASAAAARVAFSPFTL